MSQNNTSQQPKKVTSVVDAKPKLQKEPLGKKIKRVFFSEDVDNVGSFIFIDVLVPAIKDLLASIVENTVNVALFGSGSTRRSYLSRGNPQQRANLYWNSSVGNQRPYANERPRSTNNFREIIYETQADASRVLDGMMELVSSYGLASIADLYSFSNLSSDNYTNNDYGWTNLRGSRVVRTRDGYILELPKPTLLPT